MDGNDLRDMIKGSKIIFQASGGKKKPLKVSINNQNYLYEIIRKYPNIKSGRKIYHGHYIRVLKNILLTNFFENNIDDMEKIFLNKFYFNCDKTSIKINLKKNKI